MPIFKTPRAQIHYRFDGPETGPVLVLSTVVGTSLGMWDSVVPELARYLRVLRYDYRGHGGSPPVSGPYGIDALGQDVLDLLDGFGIARASLCGISLGGMVTLWLAAHAPDRVDRIVPACTAAVFHGGAALRERAAAVRAQGIAPVLGPLAGRWFTPGFRQAHPDEVARIIAQIGAASPESYAVTCEIVAGLDLRADLPRITAPTLVIAGREDIGATPADALAIAELIPGAAVTVLAGAAHIASVEQPQRFAAAVLDHVLGTTAERGRHVRSAVLGTAHVESAGASAFGADFQDFLTRYAWGDVWSRPGLDRRMRSALAIAMLVARGRFDELALHLRGGIRNGLTPAEISEILLQSAIYCGVPAANAAFAVAQRVLTKDE